MFLHEELEICFLAEPKHGTEITRDHLKERGFIMVGGHHDNPIDIGAKRLADVGNGNIWIGKWNRVRFFSTVRHPGEVILSYATEGTEGKRFKARGGTIDIEDITRIMWDNNSAHFPERHRFWRHAWITPRLTTLRFESLREDLNELFCTFGLDPLPKSEWKINPKYVTTDKPKDGWYRYWTQRAMDWFNEQFKSDLQRFNYYLRTPKRHS
jgi:hypothetical protein